MSKKDELKGVFPGICALAATLGFFATIGALCAFSIYRYLF